MCLISNDDDPCYRQEIDPFVAWCDDLKLNIKKRKGLLIWGKIGLALMK